jgi:hypothetical protein
MKKISAVLHLLTVEEAASFNVAACLGKMFLESLHPSRIVLVQRLVELVLDGKVGAWRTPDEEQRLIAINNVPCLFYGL